MDLLIWGATGNGKVVHEIASLNGHRVLAFFDNNPKQQSPYSDIPLIGGTGALEAWAKSRAGQVTGFVVTMGGGFGKDRVTLINLLSGLGFEPVNMIHPRAYVSASAILHPSAQVYAMASVCTEAVIGKGCLINTGASIDHESRLGEGVFVGPGARLAGLVEVERYADIYTGAIVLPRIRIGEGAVVGAGAVVRQDVPPYTVVAGNPARVIKEIPAQP